jgi:NADP-dependent 3-hydroxy acid dehydrogenase YdfG
LQTVLAGYAAIVTGAGTGIGAAVAEELVSSGVRVVLIGRRQRVIQNQMKRLIAAGGEALAVTAMFAITRR